MSPKIIVFYSRKENSVAFGESEKEILFSLSFTHAVQLNILLGKNVTARKVRIVTIKKADVITTKRIK